MDSKNLLKRIRAYLHLETKPEMDDILSEPPLPSELFNADQMQRYAISLAMSQTLVSTLVPDILLKRLAESESTLTEACKSLEENTTESYSPAREWLLDNFYVIQEEIYSIRRNLPKEYGRTLPQLAVSTPGYPRVYDIALEIIKHSDGHWNLEIISRFITAYQSIKPLTLGELWSIPLMLGIALVENLKFASLRVVANRKDRQLAAYWAERLTETAISEPKQQVMLLAEMTQSNLPTSSAFVAELARRLQNASLPLPLSWIEQHLSQEGLTIDQMIQDENCALAANQVTVSNSIVSLKHLGEVDWRDFVEAMSIVEQTLRQDPTAIYSKMDFATRDHYRHVVERLARASHISENAVAEAAIQLAKAAPLEMRERHGHVGYYLIEEGIIQLEKELGLLRSPWQKLRYFFGQHALDCYLGSIAFITITLVYLLMRNVNHYSPGTLWWLIMGMSITIAVSQLSMGLVNLAVTLLVKPQPLPRMDFSEGIPEALRTLVVVPAMLNNKTQIKSLIEALEIRFLGNQDDYLQFMLLTDFNDAPQETMPEDASLLALARKQITALNERYAKREQDIFLFCHRPRLWNAKENVWMGRERKRGKLTDLNKLLRANDQTNFSLIVGDVSLLANIKYVITLDSDTQLPRESARQYVATMAHPLNLPQLNDKMQRVIKGYGILQPRVAEALPLRGLNAYARLCGHGVGIDPYTRSVSNVYQDLFEEGSFVGKGIYNVSLFQQLLSERFPDNHILSHDLLEGCYLRSGFLSDVPLYEVSPDNYLTDVKRRARWIRGDWQIADWLLPSVLNKANQAVTNPLSGLSKFKIFDNLRRSLVATSLLILFVLSFFILPDTRFLMRITVLIIILPAVINILLETVRKPANVLPRQHAANIMHVVYRGIGQLILYLACLPHECWYSLTAIFQTLWRVVISKRHLLEWTPSDQIKQSKNTLTEWFSAMWMGPVLAIAIALALYLEDRPHILVYATPLLILWFMSPALARWLSLPTRRKVAKLDVNQINFLHFMARKTWDFFDTFMTADNHWLPPDNFQQAPVEVLARRTSPTNIGLSLLSNLAAYDFGYITMKQLLERTSHTLETMLSLERYHGHLYNWYDTATLAPLLPRYVSTVDSGNLIGHLLTLRQGLLALMDDPIFNRCWLQGLQDTLAVLIAESDPSLVKEFYPFQQLLLKAPASFQDWESAKAYGQKLFETAEKIQTNSEWTNKLLSQCHAMRDEIRLFSTPSALPLHATLHEALQASSEEAKTRAELIDQLSKQILTLTKIDVDFLYDETTHLLSIGFNVDTQRRDNSYYDLLSSEARFAYFVVIAQGQIRQESWFALGRLLVATGGIPVLVSWSGSMFEYLMPLLVMPTYDDTLLDQTYHAAVKQQMIYGKKRGVPWGVSESGYNALDTSYNYLYRAFGVPGLGLKRGLEDDLVIAPYASVMALMVTPALACQNLQRLHRENAAGKFGFYEAIDYTPSRLPRDSKKAIVRSFMSHHQGMSLLSYTYLLHNRSMQRRFLADPQFQATLLLLQERIPKPTNDYLHIARAPDEGAYANNPEGSMRVFTTPHTRTPQVQLLSNGRYHTVITQAGGGYSRWNDITLTRWREDSTCDDWGLFSYVRDVSTGDFYSTTYQPTAKMPDDFKVVFSEAHAEFSSSINKLHFHSEIVVSAEDDIELRRLRIHNRSRTRRTIEFTSYAEIVMAPQGADLAQPAFSNLFIETELLSGKQAILVTRRPDDASKTSPWLCHLLNVYSEDPVSVSYETDRARFLGRDRTLANPLVMDQVGPLSNTMGAVLDPIIAIRCEVTLEADASILFDLITGIAETRPQCIKLIDKYQDRNLANRIFDLAWTHGQVMLHHLNINEMDAQLYARLAGAVIYASNTRRADAKTLMSNRRGQSSLWPYAISGDLPIVLLHIGDAANIELVQQLVQAQIYWRNKGLFVDIVILNKEPPSYRQSLQDQIMNLIAGNISSEHNGTIIVRSAEQIPDEDLILLQTVARVIISDERGSLKEQLSRRRVAPPVMPLLSVKKVLRESNLNMLPPLPDLQFFNTYGGYSQQGDEYIIRLVAGAPTPAPWSNVLANPMFGTLVSESGQGYTWTENAHEFRLTPWDNDPLKDTSGEAFYLRDEITGEIWSPAALPCRGQGDYQTHHGFGYSTFEHIETGIYSKMCIYVAHDAPIKYIALTIRNDSPSTRQLSVTGYVAWVLGDLRSKNMMYVMTEQTNRGTILAQNHYNTAFQDRTAFFDAGTSHHDLIARTITGDRTEFIGRNGKLSAPAALKRKRLSGRVGAGYDPCAAIQLTFELEEGQSREIIFTLGAGENKQDATQLAERYCDLTTGKNELATIRQFWQETLNRVHVTTPDKSVNLLANGWLLYQVLSSRLWGRTGYYQSSGAFGFRDQLQDVMSLVHIAPQLLRAHIVLCAHHQFEEGDVQHWWHPPQNRGVRTRCSDDYLWLPFAVCRYIEATGDESLLNEITPFLQGRPLKPNEESYYELPTVSGTTGDIYEHAVRAIKHGFTFGVHDLPLMGSGDWNDGMNLVGKDGKGESVWLAFFLFSVLKHFSPIATARGDTDFAAQCEAEKQKLQIAIEENGWDGKWYRRAYFDDGTPLGSASNTECRIDSIAQSWSVLSGGANLEKTKQAMNSFYQELVSEADGTIKLLAPPFDQSKPDPGYIQGYVPGIRENGGQYTHAAVWSAMAFAELHDKKLAWQLFHILNPINHGRTLQEIHRYKIEPYVLAGDVYSVAPHIGRGGWSWYTGSAGWLYRLIMESLLGVQLIHGNTLRLAPLLPENWDGFKIEYQYGKTVYHIQVNRGDKNSIEVDGKVVEKLALISDDASHEVKVKVV